ncbi:MAG: alpha/beta hydrolase [Gemmatimonadaceae bacterium]
MATIHHSLQLRDRAVVAVMRVVMASMKGSYSGDAARASFDELMEKVPSLPHVTYLEAEVGGVPGFWCRPANSAPGKVILYLHGGAYVVGSARAFRHFVGQIAGRAGVAAFVPEYRLPPEYPFPAAFEDALATYDGLDASDCTRIALAGDSAGGGLALALLSLASARARGGGGVGPVCAAVISPWTDLTLSGMSVKTRAKADPLLTRDALASAARLYLDDHDPRDPLASPLFGDLTGLPPVRIHVGEDEILLDDSLRYARKLDQLGGTSEVHSWKGMVHVFPSNVAHLKASIDALDDIAGFLRVRLQVAG